MIKLTKLISEEKNPRTIDAVYVEQNKRFYGLYVGTSRKKMGYLEDANKLVKDITGLELPRIYDTKQLDKITKVMKTRGVKFTHDDIMDVS